MESQVKAINGIPVDADVMFSNHKNVYKKGIEKRQTKLMKYAAFLKPFLDKDEKVLLVATGCSPMSLVEQLLTGWVIFYLKRSLFIFTNKRIFHIPTKSNFAYRNSICQVMYSDCKEMSVKRGILQLTYRSGDTEKFVYMSAKERKKINSILGGMPRTEAMSRSGKRVHLCPRCADVLHAGKYACPSCRLAFKSKDEARRISILFPGGGYFFTGHPWLGIGDAITETVLTVLLVISLYGLFTGEPEALTAVIMFGVILALEKVMTVYHSNHFVKEYIPVDKDVTPRITAE